MISRRKMYQAGEPLGDSATRREGGRVVYGGGGGGSSSSSSNTTTNTTDKRMVVDQGIGISSDQSTVNVQALDGKIVSQAMDTIKAADATNGESFSALLTLADRLFTAGGNVLQTQADATMAQVGALNTIANDQKGVIDQKTLIILAGAGIAALALRRKG